MIVRRRHRLRAAAWAAVGVVALTMAGCAAEPAHGSSSAPHPASPAPKPAPTRTPTVASDAVIVTIGDSIMSGYGLDPDEAWPVLLGEQTHLDIVNLSCGGAGFVVDGDCGTNFSALAQEAIGLDPAMVILQSSDNDADEDVDDIDSATRATVEELHEALPSTRIVGLSTLWNQPWEAPQSIAWSSDALRSAVEAADGTFVWLGQPLQENPELLQWDSEHPTAEGQEYLARHVRAVLAHAGIVL
ncbi:SGNH/GDSL hydrolase family protein [Microbacterium sp. SORGH_AS_0428]|uniref:SGNH/GDSL hydrolase family protein n=1 Tax=Microbacterium sp. SORGH_AS_0428 TaxID=3041788 RepID=UPI00286B7A89|nr:SGNH/GDSL hydrolase family protein [Microbacterium sp. SORGH_AS_0428]